MSEKFGLLRYGFVLVHLFPFGLLIINHHLDILNIIAYTHLVKISAFILLCSYKILRVSKGYDTLLKALEAELCC